MESLEYQSAVRSVPDNFVGHFRFVIYGSIASLLFQLSKSMGSFAVASIFIFWVLITYLLALFRYFRSTKEARAKSRLLVVTATVAVISAWVVGMTKSDGWS